ncbi:hypothetical protein JOL79_11640 [Microbispora sp. RL4-1S]|uniref:Lipoprotein n=1 Tax=Microbispora oryzae TaxID=2806554 RepID=A0A940WJL5_9ACTN|nr:hypothetical protein [Microbispora oryzae]MBP2704467.1 hypothetical protein [Microbispora oryzae]
MAKATTSLTLTTLAALSLACAATACSDDGPDVTADCVVKQADGSYKQVDDDYCDDHHHGGGSTFVWIYGGSHGNGGRVTGGSFTRPANANITSSSGKVISRGGFGGRAGAGS